MEPLHSKLHVRKCTKCLVVMASYAPKGTKTPICCAGCADKDTMEDVTHRHRCTKCKTTFASYALKGTTRPICCAGCADKETMEDITRRKCVICKEKPAGYGLKGTTKSTHCSNCKDSETMEYLGSRTKKCVVCKITVSSYCLKGTVKPTHCSKCKDPDTMERISGKCITCKDTFASFALIGTTKAIYCAGCTNRDTTEPVFKCCSVYGCSLYVFKKASVHKLCSQHFVEKFPDSDVLTRIKFKERGVVLELKKMFPELKFVWDKNVSKCSKKRPDLLVDLGVIILIIDVDEHAHADYDVSCEKSRIIEIVYQFDSPVYMIRFNTDECKLRPSAFKNSYKDGELAFRKNEWVERFETLVNEIQHVIKMNSCEDPEKLYRFTGVRLYYPTDEHERTEFELPWMSSSS